MRNEIFIHSQQRIIKNERRLSRELTVQLTQVFRGILAHACSPTKPPATQAKEEIFQ